MSEANPYHRRYFPAFKVDFLVAAGQPLPPSLGIPDLYAPFINEHWQQRGKGEILGVITRPSSEDREQDWTKLGQQLTTDLLAMGTHAGLSFDGQLPLDIELAWLPQFMQSRQLGVVDVKICTSAHPVRNDAWMKNVTWNSLQSADAGSWLVSLWSNVKSMWFHYGCDLLLSVYETDVTSAIAWGESLTIAVFGHTLARAVGWMIPIDGNIGFIVGLPRDSTLYENLTASRPPMPKDGKLS